MKVLQNNFVFWVEVSQLGGNLLRDRYLMCDTLALRCHEVSQGVIEVPPLSKGRLGGDCAKRS